MQSTQRDFRRLHNLLLTIVVLAILADQLSKAYFVFKLGTHKAESFLTFLAQYFQLWGEIDGGGAIRSHYFPFLPHISVWEPWIRFTLTTNTGAAWSIFTGKSFLLSFVSLVMAILLYLIWRRSFRGNLAMTWALAGIIGGALGNGIDRFRLKEVVDFVEVKIPLIGRIFPQLGDPYDFPIFNVADSCAVCGTLALAIYLALVDLRHARRRRQAAHEAPRPFPEGPALDTAALAELRRLADTERLTAAIGMTRHHAVPPADMPPGQTPACGDEGGGDGS